MAGQRATSKTRLTHQIRSPAHRKATLHDDNDETILLLLLLLAPIAESTNNDDSTTTSAIKIYDNVLPEETRKLLHQECVEWDSEKVVFVFP